MKTLYTNGCSWTYGNGCEDKPEIAARSPNVDFRDYAWPKFLSQSLKFNCVNDSIGGGSNSRIFRRTLDYVTRLAHEERKNTIVVLAWTLIERSEIYVSDLKESEAGWFRFNVTQPFSSYYYTPFGPKEYDPRVQAIDEYQKIFDREIFDRRGSMEMFLNQVMTLTAFLNACDVPHLFFSALPNYQHIYTDEMQHLTHLMPFFESRNIVNMNAPWSIRLKSTELTSCQHPTVEAHEAWANYLKQELRERGIHE